MRDVYNLLHSLIFRTAIKYAYTTCRPTDYSVRLVIFFRSRYTQLHKNSNESIQPICQLIRLVNLISQLHLAILVGTQLQCTPLPFEIRNN
jgi:hypothetical protein